MKPLWEHQQRDIQRLLTEPEIFNTSDPGTGKTRVVIEAIKQLNIPTLILAPKSILSCAWGNDFFSFAHEVNYSIATATNRRKAFEAGTPVVITNHDAVSWLVKPENIGLLERFRGGMLVIDESTCFKNPTAKRSKAAATLRKLFSRCVCMSGTPSPQGVIDLWHQVYLVDQGKLLGNSYYRFRSSTHESIQKGPFTEWKEKPGVLDAIGEIISPITIRNKREDCMDLPDNLITTRSIELSKDHMKMYKELRRTALLELESGEVAGINAAVLRGKLLQVASGAVYGEGGEAHLIDTDRYELIMDLIEERNHSVVFFNWKHQRDELIKAAKKRGFTYDVIDGSVTSMEARTNTVNSFQGGELKFLLCHPQSAGHGLTLTRGLATIWASPTDNAEHFMQANARIWRGGQTQKTETILISAQGTLEEKAYKALTEKVTNMNDLLGLLE